MMNKLSMVAGFMAALFLMVAGDSASAHGKYNTAQLAYSGKGPWMMDYNAANQKAKKEHKDLFVLFTGSDWCKYCKVLEDRTLSHAGFIENITDDFVLVFMDSPRSSKLKEKIPPEIKKLRKELAKKFGVGGVPTAFLMTADEKIYHRSVGASPLTPEAYAAEAIKAKRAYRERLRIQAKLQGDNVSLKEKVRLLDELLSSVPPASALKDYRKEMDDIIRLDAGNKEGMEMKYKNLIVVKEAKALVENGFHVEQSLVVVEKALREYKYTGKYLQRLLSLKSSAVLTDAYNTKDETRIDKLAAGIRVQKEAIEAAPNTPEADKLRKHKKNMLRILNGARREKVARAKLEDKSIQGVERAKILDELLTALQMQRLLNTPLCWKEKAPYVKEIIALDPENKAGLKARYDKDAIEQEIALQIPKRDMEGVYKNIDKMLRNCEINNPEERQNLLMRKARAMMLLNRSREDVIAVLRRAHFSSPRSKLAGRISRYAKVLGNPKVKVKLVGLFGPTLVLADGKKVDVSCLNGNAYIGVYSSAHWCGPCKHFTPRLVRFRDASQKTDKKFEVVFMSRDRNEDEMYGYMKAFRMKWLAAPFEGNIRSYMKKYLNVTGIPDLAIFDGDGNFITLAGRDDVGRFGAGAFKKWDAASKRNAARRAARK
jgi:thioredoxin-related protein